MSDAPRKRSNAVVLTLIGLPFAAIAVADAFPPQDMRRNLYPDRAACERDYSAAQCEQGTGSSSGSSGGGYGGSGWHGPYYTADRSSATSGDPGTGRSGQVTRTETSSRGGFGAFGRFARSVG